MATRYLAGTGSLPPEYDYSILRRQLSENERLYLLAEKAADLGKEALALEYLEKSERQAPG